jgi:hypothetical protein
MEPRSQSTPTERWIILAGLIGAGILVALLVVAASSRLHVLDRIVWIFFGALVLDVVSLLARWLLTNSRRRLFLLGRYPAAIALAKSVAVVAVLSLTLFAGVAQLAGGDIGRNSLTALIVGFLLFAIVAAAGNGLLNALIVSRHLRGTLAETSREPVRRGR